MLNKANNFTSMKVKIEFFFFNSRRGRGTNMLQSRPSLNVILSIISLLKGTYINIWINILIIKEVSKDISYLTNSLATQ